MSSLSLVRFHLMNFFFFHFGEKKAMKGVFFFIFEILKRGFRKKKNLKKIKAVLRANPFSKF